MSDQRRIVSATPENSETPLEALRSWVTPTRLFFVRNHFDVPMLDAEAWRLTIAGCVRQPVELTYRQLCDLPQRSVLATIECAGNGRSFLEQHVHGVQWGAGAIGHAEWSGVPLRAVLEMAGLRDDALEVVFEGADCGTEPDSPEQLQFARSLPVDKAMHADTLLALHMNGEPLERNHGFPVRLLVPGWYGVASVKWLTHITAAAEPFEGYFQTYKYTIQRRSGGVERTVGLQSMAVKSSIVRPTAGQSLGLGTQRVFGVAWAGEEQVARVEVSTDGGSSWSDAQLLGPHAPYSWTLWEYLWKVTQPGPYALVTRATSASGTRQPDAHDPLHGGYMIHFCLPLQVSVAAGATEPAKAVDAGAMLYDMNAFAEANAAMPLDVHLEFSHGAGI